MNINQLADNYHSTGKESTRNEIVKQAEPYIGKIMNKTPLPNVSAYDFDDLKQVGRIAVIQSLDRYDPNRNSLFSTYMYIRVRGAIYSYIRKHDPLSRTQRERIGEIRQYKHEFQQEFNRFPTTKEIAVYMGESSEYVSRLLMAESSRQSDQVDWDESAHIHDEDRSLELKFDKQWLIEIMKTLPVRDRVLIVAMFWLDLDGRECADLFDYSNRHYIYRLKNKTLKKLREYVE